MTLKLLIIAVKQILIIGGGIVVGEMVAWWRNVSISSIKWQSKAS